MVHQYNSAIDLAKQHQRGLLVESGPGTGKTTAVVLRAHLLRERVENPSNVLITTFSRAAAERAQLVYYTIFKTEHPGQFSTISKASCQEVLRYINRINSKNINCKFISKDELSATKLDTEFSYYLKREHNFNDLLRIFQNPSQLSRAIEISTYYMHIDKIKLFLNNNIFGNYEDTYSFVCDRISEDKNIRQGYKDLLGKFKDIVKFFKNPEKLGIYYLDFLTRWMAEKHEKRRIAYIDYTLAPLWASYMIDRDKDPRDFYSYIIMDEAQDLNFSDFLFINSLSNEVKNNIDCFYDPNQKVFGYRGSLGKHIVPLMQMYLENQGAKPVFCQLVTNMRSHKNIVYFTETYKKYAFNDSRSQRPWEQWPDARFLPLLIATSQAAIPAHVVKCIQTIVKAGGRYDNFCVITDDENEVRNALIANKIPVSAPQNHQITLAIKALIATLFSLADTQDNPHAFDLDAFLALQACAKVVAERSPQRAPAIVEQLQRKLTSPQVEEAYQSARIDEDDHAMDNAARNHLISVACNCVRENHDQENQDIEKIINEIINLYRDLCNKFENLIENRENKYDANKYKVHRVITYIMLNVFNLQNNYIIRWLEHLKNCFKEQSFRPFESGDLSREWRTTLNSIGQAIMDYDSLRVGQTIWGFILNRLLANLGLVQEGTVMVAKPGAVKGLEFDVVFVVLPKGSQTMSPQDINNLYVALTRARFWVVILWDALQNNNKKINYKYRFVGLSGNKNEITGLNSFLKKILEEAISKDQAFLISMQDPKSSIQAVSNIASAYHTFRSMCLQHMPILNVSQFIGQGI